LTLFDLVDFIGWHLSYWLAYWSGPPSCLDNVTVASHGAFL